MSGAGSPHAVAHRRIVTPPQRKRNYVPNSRSSDSLPDLADILPTKVDARLKTGSRAVALPQSAAAGFQSTSRLLKYNLLSLQQENEKDEHIEKQKKTTATRPRIKAQEASTEQNEGEGICNATEEKSKKRSTANIGFEKRGSRKRKSEGDKDEIASKQSVRHGDHLIQDSGAAADDATHTDQKPGESSNQKRRRLNCGRAGQKGTLEQTHTSKRPSKEKRTGRDPKRLNQDTKSLLSPSVIENDGHYTGKESNLGLNKTVPGENTFVDIDIYEVPVSPCKESPAEPLTKKEKRVRAARKTTAQTSTHFMHEEELKSYAEVPPNISTEQVGHSGILEPTGNRMDSTASPKSNPVAGRARGENESRILSPASQENMPEAPRLDFSELHQQFGYDGALSASISPARGVKRTTVLSPRQKIVPVSDLPPQTLTIIIEQPGSAPFVPAETLLSEAKESPTKKLPQRSSEPVLAPQITKEGAKISPKKGPMSITARSIARYAPINPANVEPPPVVSPHFAPIFTKPDEQVTTEPAQKTEQPAKPARSRKPRKSRDKDGKAIESKQKKQSAKSKKVAFVAPKIVSPEQHEAKLKRQDLLFGTSSQLRQDGSPRYVREMLRALQESVVDATEPVERGSSPIPLRSTEAIRRTKRKLWNESAHIDADSGWQDISDFDSPEIPTVLTEDVKKQDNIVRATLASPDASTMNPDEDAFKVLLTKESSPVPSIEIWIGKDRITSAQPLSPGLPMMATAITLPSSSRYSVSPSRLALRSLSTNTKSRAKQLRGEIPEATKAASVLPIAGDDVTIANAKAKKPRSQSQKTIRSEQIPSPARPRGRPRKTAVPSPGLPTPIEHDHLPKVGVAEDDNDGFQHIDDIEDSQSDHTPSPPRKRGTPSNSQPLPLSTTAETETNGKRSNTIIVNAQHPRWPSVKAKLFREITATVKSAPPTGSIKNPSWHEKMLLYDPIVLEDLTEWLNRQSLRVEGKDGALVEISCWMVQSWCEMNSICCLWKGGLRGGVRTRY